MILRVLTTLLLSAFIFINTNITHGALFLLILIIFSTLYRGHPMRRVMRFILLAAFWVILLQMIFRKGEIVLFSLGPVNFYKAGFFMGLNVTMVFLSMLFIISILGTADPDILFSRLEAARFPRVMIFPLFTAYRFLPALSHQARVMNHYASIRTRRTKRSGLSLIRDYSSLLIPFFVSVFKRVFYMWLSVERRNIENVKPLFAYRRDRITFLDIIYFSLSVLLCVSWVYWGKEML